LTAQSRRLVLRFRGIFNDLKPWTRHPISRHPALLLYTDTQRTYVAAGIKNS
jgi:hypothetical protein